MERNPSPPLTTPQTYTSRRLSTSNFPSSMDEEFDSVDFEPLVLVIIDDKIRFEEREFIYEGISLLNHCQRHIEHEADPPIPTTDDKPVNHLTLYGFLALAVARDAERDAAAIAIYQSKTQIRVFISMAMDTMKNSPISSVTQHETQLLTRRHFTVASSSSDSLLQSHGPWMSRKIFEMFPECSAPTQIRETSPRGFPVLQQICSNCTLNMQRMKIEILQQGVMLIKMPRPTPPLAIYLTDWLMY